MSELPVELIRAALLRYAEEELDWAEYGSFINYSDAQNRYYDVPGLGIVKIADYNDYDSDKNYDGWEEQLFVVFDIGGTLYKATGTYTSHVGSEWNEELKVVVPKEKTIVVYEEQ
jgi:hypothetical protein